MIEEAVVHALTRANIHLPPDVKNALKKAYKTEDSEVARVQIEAILRNLELAEELNRPICQDTGLIVYYVRMGYDFGVRIDVIERALINATRRATAEIPLRPNTVDPLTGENPGDNTGRNSPIIHWEFMKGDSLEIVVVPKGGGSEYVTVLEMIPPGLGLGGVKRVVIDAVLEAGAKPCPPTIVGVGLGGGVDTAVYLAKKAACIRRLDTMNPNPTLARLEDELYSELNSLGIGPQGLGGRTTVLGVHIDYSHRHPASYPVAVVFQCWAARRATVLVGRDGSSTIIQ
ncbi:MAG: fumarate hydratase [Thermoprotei archaeon]|nr:MAG: fumarate hydratase [Thermoprotei archaeon]